MTGPLRDVVRAARERVRTFFDAPLAADARPLELLETALDQLERKAEPSGRGSRVFPYTRVVVHVAQPGGDRAAIDAVFSRLDARLRERLAEIRCEVPPSLVASASVTDSTGNDAPILRIECSRDTAAAALPVTPSQLQELRLTVVKGQCGQSEYAFTGGTIAIGRGADPEDAFGRVRHNAIAFLDARDGVTETVARAHARVEFDPALGAYVVVNESSSNPTFLVRDGRSLRINPRDPRGVRVQSGDELHVGRAVVRISIGPT